MRSFVAACAAVLLCVACGSATPSAGVSFAPTNPPTPTPTDSPTPTPTPTQRATPQPTLVLSAPASLTPSPTASPNTGDLLFRDAQLSAARGWQELNLNKASMAFADGAIDSTYEKKGSWAYAVRELQTVQAVVRVSGTFASVGRGYFGWLCGDSISGRYYGAVPETDDGSLVFIDGGYDGVEPLERYENLGRPVVSGQSTSFGLECTVDHGTVWLEAFVGDGEPIAVHESEVDDVTRFDVVGMYGEALAPGFTMTGGNVSAFGSGGASGATSIAAASFIATLPLAVGTDCVERPVDDDRLVSVRCYIQDEGAGAEFFDVTQYPDEDAMNGAFDAAAPSATTPCSSAVAAQTWTSGQLRCVAQTVGVRLEWTDARSLSVGRIVDFDGTPANLYAQWSTTLGQ
jgi:hypothetical protein